MRCSMDRRELFAQNQFARRWIRQWPARSRFSSPQAPGPIGHRPGSRTPTPRAIPRSGCPWWGRRRPCRLHVAPAQGFGHFAGKVLGGHRREGQRERQGRSPMDSSSPVYSEASRDDSQGRLCNPNVNTASTCSPRSGKLPSRTASPARRSTSRPQNARRTPETSARLSRSPGQPSSTSSTAAR